MVSVEQFLNETPDDVADSVGWLVAQGGQATSVVPRHGMGFAMLQVEFGEVEIRFVSDRDVWHLDLREHDDEWLPVDLIYAVLSGDETAWPPALTDWTQQVPQQPNIAFWRNHLPPVLDWLGSTPNASTLVLEAGRRRSDVLFRSQGRR